MGQFSINFVTNVVREDNQDPYYRVEVSTGILADSYANNVDGDLLLIERKKTADGYLDVFYGIVKAVDFVAFRKVSPNAGQNMYRARNWTLVFYNQKTMDEAIALMKHQVDILAEDVTLLRNTANKRSVTHLSPNF